MIKSPIFSAVLLAASLASGLPALAENPIIARVAGQEITQQELQLAEREMDAEFANIPADKKRAAILSALIDIKLLAQAAKEAGIDKSDEFKTQMQFSTARALHNYYFKNKVVDVISDEEVKARFEKEIAAMPAEKELKARHILVKEEEEAKAIISQLDEGKDFAELAKEKSTGPSSANGGDLGFFGKGQMVPEFDKAVFELKDGQYSKTPIKTQYGWHVILREEEREKPKPEFEAVKEQIRQVLLREKYFNIIKKARKDKPAEILDADLKAQIDAQDQ